VAVHASVSASHTLGAVPTACVTAGCHTAGSDGKDVAALHAVAGGPGCICHAAGKTLTLTCSASGRHPTYPSVPASHASHVATVTAATSITINSVTYLSMSCTTCHASLDLQLVTQHTNCATCHPSPASTAPKGYFACNQANCHGAGTLHGTAVVQHATATLNSAHTVTLQTCNAAGCHTGAYSGSSDIAAIHRVQREQVRDVPQHQRQGGLDMRHSRVSQLGQRVPDGCLFGRIQRGSAPGRGHEVQHDHLQPEPGLPWLQR